MSSILRIGQYCSTYNTIKEARAVKMLKKRIHNMGYNLSTMSHTEKLKLYKELSNV